MKKIYFQTLLLFIFVFIQISCVKAQDSSRIRISLLTCTPGQELYSIFGHSALRVIDKTDSNNVTDHVYNFGTFNFDDPGFYLKFVRGQLRYYVNVEQFEDFKFKENPNAIFRILLPEDSSKKIKKVELINTSDCVERGYSRTTLFDTTKEKNYSKFT